MSIFKALIDLIFGRGKQQPNEQPKPEPQPLPEGVEEIVPHSDPRVAATNGDRGLLTWEEQTGPNQWTFHYESGKETYIGTPGKPSDFNAHGITTTVLPKMLHCVSDVMQGRDLSEWPEQQIFDARVYLGKIIIQRGN